MWTINPITWKWSLDTQNDYANQYTNSQIIMPGINTPTNTTNPTNTSGLSMDTSIFLPDANLYGKNREDILKMKYNLWTQYTNAVAWFNEADIVDKMRLKTGWTADIDKQIQNLKVDMNKSRPELMKRYANIIDPKQREALISAEESSIAKQINDLQSIKQYRLWTISDMVQWEVARWEQKLRALEAQYKLYSDVLWDMDKADKAKMDMEKTALDIQQKRLELDNYKKESQLNIIWKEQNLWVTWQPGKTQYWTTDFTWLQEKYPLNASFKNNNPGNIKYTQEWANTLKKYWIEISIWSQAKDWWNFARYNSIEDWLIWRNILLFHTWTYPNLTVDQAMKRYSNNWYWAEITWVDWNKKMKDLTTAERSKLILWQLKGEDQAMYQEMVNSWIDPTKYVVEWKYIETEWWKKANEFDITTVDEYLSKQANYANNLATKITPVNADKILQDDIWKWELWTKADKLLDKASDDVYNEYVKADAIEQLKKETDVTAITSAVEKLLESYSEQEVIDMLKEAGVFEKKWFEKGFFNDDAWYDTLQTLLPSL